MKNPRGRRRAWIVALVLLSAVLAVVSVLAVRQGSSGGLRWRVHVVLLKAKGQLADVTWRELFTMSGSGDRYQFSRVLEKGNVYAAVKNPYDAEQDRSAGGELFRSSCASCHGADAAGGSGPALKGRPFTHGDTDWAIYKTISLGVTQTNMRGFALKGEDLWRLVAYVRAVRGHESGRPNPGAILTPPPPPVSYEDLVHAGETPDRWLTYSGSYDSHRFSAAAQVTPGNADRLRLAWMRQYDTPEASIETTPLVVGPYMFVTIPPNDVEAIDVRSGARLWSYHRTLPNDLATCCGYVNRGLAVLGNRLFLGTLDAALVALDISTGQVVWTAEIADYTRGYSITGAPLALKGMVVTGVSGGEYGIRGFVDARDALTGRQLWRFDTIPEPRPPSISTWPGATWKTGGGPTWLTGSFDPVLNVIYWAVGNPGPNFRGDLREGDNLYSDSVVALDADSGTLKWHYQFTPHDEFDWDATEMLVLVNANRDGRPGRFLAQANRNAFYYLLDRTDGRFLLGSPFAKQTWADRIDDKGRPVRRADARPTARGTEIAPSGSGATNWASPSYDPGSQSLYVAAVEMSAVFMTGAAPYQAGRPFTGGGFSNTSDSPRVAVRSLNALTGALQWEYGVTAGLPIGGVLSTAGGLVFGSLGEAFFALDAKTGSRVWSINTGGQISAAPITFVCEGRQYVTIAAGRALLTFVLEIDPREQPAGRVGAPR